MRLRRFAAIGAVALLAATPVGAQSSTGVTLGTSPAPGINVAPPLPRPQAPPPPVPGRPTTPGRPATPDSPRGDLFLARPDTYAPRYDRQNQSLFFPYAIGAGYYYPYSAGYPGSGYDPGDRNLTIIVAAAPDSQSLASLAAPAPSVVPTPLPPAPKKTFYVIPRCYAGDAPPRADRLPGGCRMTDLLSLPPR